MFDQAVNDTFENESDEFVAGEIDQGVPSSQDPMLPKSRIKKKRKIDQRSQKSYDAYFNYLPFEKAVI